jgi:hypothetical protein
LTQLKRPCSVGRDGSQMWAFSYSVSSVSGLKRTMRSELHRQPQFRVFILNSRLIPSEVTMNDNQALCPHRRNEEGLFDSICRTCFAPHCLVSHKGPLYNIGIFQGISLITGRRGQFSKPRCYARQAQRFQECEWPNWGMRQLALRLPPVPGHRRFSTNAEREA